MTGWGSWPLVRSSFATIRTWSLQRQPLTQFDLGGRAYMDYGNDRYAYQIC